MTKRLSGTPPGPAATLRWLNKQFGIAEPFPQDAFDGDFPLDPNRDPEAARAAIAYHRGPRT